MPDLKVENKKENPALKVEEMARAGLHFGHRKFRLHPKMKPYIFTIRNSISIIDLEKTAEKITETLDFIKNLVSEGKTLLLVGTKIQVKEMVKEIANECGILYVNEKWLRGTFTNFDIINKRISYYRSLEQKITSGELEKYTKKERAKFNQELLKLKSKLEGIKTMEKLPDAIFVLDIDKDEIAVKEAKKKNIKVIGIVDTISDPSTVDYMIPANDDATSSVKFILDRVKEVILKARKEAPKTKTEKE